MTIVRGYIPSVVLIFVVVVIVTVVIAGKAIDAVDGFALVPSISSISSSIIKSESRSVTSSPLLLSSFSPFHRYRKRRQKQPKQVSSVLSTDVSSSSSRTRTTTRLPLSFSSSYLDSLGGPTTSSGGYDDTLEAKNNESDDNDEEEDCDPSVSDNDSPLISPIKIPIVIGHWNQNPSSLAEAKNLLKLIAANFQNHRDPYSSVVTTTAGTVISSQVVICPPSPFLMLAIDLLEGTGIHVGAQRCSSDLSIEMIQSMGCEFVVLGHPVEESGRGQSSNKDINAKLQQCIVPNMNVVVCIGETDSERKSNLMKSAMDIQLKQIMDGVTGRQVSNQVVIAYTPAWSGISIPQIDTGLSIIRGILTEMYGSNISPRIRVVYGGKGDDTVDPNTIQKIMALSDVDGVLVDGSSSLVADSFTRIVDGATKMLDNKPVEDLANPPFDTSQQVQQQLPPRELTAREVLSTKNVLGESPVWSVRDSCLYWISAPEEEVWCWNMVDEPYRRLMGTTLGCVVVKQGPVGSIVVAGERAILGVTMTSTTHDFASGPSVICDRPDLASATRPNDGRVDRQGRFVFGGYNNYHRAGSSEGSNNAGLYRLNHDLQYEKLLDYKFRVSNCICFPGDGRTMFFCDTPTRKVYQFDYPDGNDSSATLSNRKLIWTVPPNLPGGPDGATVDADGCIWIAVSGASRVVRVVPSTGHVDYVVNLPVKSPTSCTFGGKDLDELFITTRGPDGGGLYRAKMPFGIRGLPEPEFNIGNDDARTGKIDALPY